MSDPSPSIVALVVGIDEYDGLPRLKRAVGDANKFEASLRNRFPGAKITTLLNNEATKDGIINKLSSLPPPNFRRNNPLVLFFSGYAGTAKGSDNERVGVICPVDFKRNGGIPDKTLISIFDQLSMAWGDNITFLLDCPSTVFKWAAPSSFVVVAAHKSADTTDGGVFTESLVKVLDGEDINSITGQSLADNMNAYMVTKLLSIPVDCFGKHVDRQLFSTSRTAHYAFISGRNQMKITLAAGRAHGMKPGVVLAIYSTNLVPAGKRIGYLVVESVDDDFTSTLLPVDVSSNHVPAVFHAVDTSCPHKVDVFFAQESNHASQIESLPNVNKVDKAEDAKIVINSNRDDALLIWNERIGETNFTSETQVSQTLVPSIIKNVARFDYHVARTSVSDWLMNNLEVKLREIKTDGGGASVPGNEVPQEKGTLVRLTLPRGKTLGPYCLVIRNPNAVPLWPYVLICDADHAMIQSWYTPPVTNKAPLDVRAALDIGCSVDEGLFIRGNVNRKSDILYIKVFATLDRTKFAFLGQGYDPSVDTLRELSTEVAAAAAALIPAPEPAPTPTIDLRLSKESVRVGHQGTKWLAQHITIVIDYVEETKDDYSSE